ncbi:sugar transferase [Tetragenococcus muriaticus]|uniref:sugar transferase n=1 Tax=Tetragenococcus muriaticus TaxID=64642 RepID=UPI0003FDCF6A|nr:sugar transferase [Tetragenococcus muriaticus]GMA45844.1 multidrug MFS transporter [Tetragenococcus muriaticus]GMA45941.1 multidrug MFS transporter [Tetragenococcus muriaticus]GMA46136.1 multidrug MFS transporter [Tetragenococcus muriaticus]GMA46280.1 multidrug MFS transporter [Tetragenococcus muriaticus]
MEKVDHTRKVSSDGQYIWLNKTEINHKYVYHFIARSVDIVGSIVGLILLSPLFLIVAFLIKKEEPEGSVLYSQIRVGRNRREFRMYKFRSMCVDADAKLAELLQHNEVEGAMFKIKDDPRITKVGKFIRKTSIDELPQLWNVLKGEMSLVGPRPPLVREVKEYGEYDKQRLLVKPGCTGLWQISGRNAVGFHEMVSLDVLYIKDLSIWNDLRIMVKTIRVILKPNDAY